MKKFTVLSLNVWIIILFLNIEAHATERIVILAPAAVDVVERLGAGEDVVGVTNSVAEFPEAMRVGTHISPGLELIASLKPTLIIATSRFSPEAAGRTGAELFIYEPKDLEGIIIACETLGEKLGRENEAKHLALELKSILAELAPVKNSPTVLYEVRSNPLSVAKDNSIIKSMLETAGMRYAFSGNAGTLSAEYLLVNQPDYYIYQEGPMNKNPVEPIKRPGWKNFRACTWKVNELEFARANTQIFERVQELNKLLAGPSPCDEGRKLYGR